VDASTASTAPKVMIACCLAMLVLRLGTKAFVCLQAVMYLYRREHGKAISPQILDFCASAAGPRAASRGLSGESPSVDLTPRLALWYRRRRLRNTEEEEHMMHVELRPIVGLGPPRGVEGGMERGRVVPPRRLSCTVGRGSDGTRGGNAFLGIIVAIALSEIRISGWRRSRGPGEGLLEKIGQYLASGVHT
jgi:hypothetical protein